MTISFLHDPGQQSACLCADGEAFGPVLVGVTNQEVAWFVDWLGEQDEVSDPLLSSRLLSLLDRFRASREVPAPSIYNVEPARRKPPAPSARRRTQRRQRA